MVTYQQMLEDGPEPVEEVWDVLNPAHCSQCYDWATGLHTWWSEPESLAGQVQIKEITIHYQGVPHATQ